MADDYQGEITNLLHRNGIFTRHERPVPIIQPRGKLRVVVGWETAERATPDLTGGNGYQIHVEVKTGRDNRFIFADWKDHQREWAQEWREKYGCEYWLAPVIETKHSPHRVKRVAYLLPYPVLMRTIKDLENAGQRSILYFAGKGTRLAARNNDAATLWERFALDWKPGTGWMIPHNHPFYLMYLKNHKPLLYQEEAV